jgi:hypothetical protein
MKPRDERFGTERMGVHERKGPTRSGTARLKALSDQEALELEPGDVVLTLRPGGVVPVHVVGVRQAMAGELGALYEVPVVDARFLDGVCLTYAPSDLLRIADADELVADEPVAEEVAA